MNNNDTLKAALAAVTGQDLEDMGEVRTFEIGPTEAEIEANISALSSQIANDFIDHPIPRGAKGWSMMDALLWLSLKPISLDGCLLVLADGDRTRLDRAAIFPIPYSEIDPSNPRDGLVFTFHKKKYKAILEIPSSSQYEPGNKPISGDIKLTGLTSSNVVFSITLTDALVVKGVDNE